MIVTVHFIGIIIFQILRNRKRLKSLTDEEGTIEKQLKFDPPLFRQRFGTVSQILVRELWRTQLKKLVDFGCGEFGLFMYLKRLTLEEVVFVDIDEYILAENLFRIEPLPVDCVRRRPTPLTVSVYRGSIIDPDYRLRKTDVVTAIELIEHLYPDTLDAFPYNVFFFIRPKLVVFTTPNADFNVAFGRAGFRHPDHKFEWTSEQFQDWGTNLTKRYPDYTVEFLGIGEGPKQFEHLGCCSQGALFIRKDILDDSYRSSDCVQCCQCDFSSPCKGQTVESKLQCTCLCSLCLPDVSVGVCTYLSQNISEKAYRPMKMCLKKSQSDQKLDFWSGSLNSDVINQSHNIFFKFLHSVSYLYEIDRGMDKDRLVGTLKYRVRTFSRLNSRFYVEEREQCEIPLTELIYGDVEMSVDEVGHLLFDNGYRVEKCLIPENDQFELCVITMAQEMEEITSSSEVTECSTSPPLENIQFELGETSSAAVEKKTDPLVDSGYLKSPSPLEVARSLPHEVSEVDLFEDLVPTPSMRSDDNKLHLKKPEVTNNRPKVLDLNRVNELDRFRNVNATKTFLKPLKSPKVDFPVAGTSSAWKKHHRKPKKSPDKDPSPLDDVKSLTNCIVQNSLNRVDSDVDSPEFIHYVEDVVDAPRERIIPLPLPVVENGDLANNNRDNEGNNLPENEQPEDVDEGIDLLNDNLEDLPVDNVAAVENNNGREEEEPINLPAIQVVEEQNDPDQLEREDDSSIAKASREVLYDVDSVPDLLEDVDIPPQPDVNPQSDVVADAAVVLVGIHPIATTASIQTNRNSFPDWLLQILGTQVATENTTGHDEPHFYCQGDGLGVHPSVIAVEVDEADNESSSEETSSSNNTQDYADAEPGPSDMVDMTSLPAESLDSVTSDGAILVDEIIRAAQDQVESSSLEESGKVASTSQTSSNQSTEPERSNLTESGSEGLEVVNDSQSVNEESNGSEIL